MPQPGPGMGAGVAPWPPRPMLAALMSFVSAVLPHVGHAGVVERLTRSSNSRSQLPQAYS